MLTEHIISLLIQERDRLNRAIEALGSPVKRRGRPSKNRVAPALETRESPVKRTFSAATRRKMAVAQKKRWAALKAAK